MVDAPSGFPRTEAEAEQTADTVGCPRAFASKTWTQSASRGWRDARDVPIRSWLHYLKSCFTYAEERDAKDKARANERPFDRNGRTAVRSKSSFQENLDQADAFIAQEKARDAADRVRDGKERAART